MISTVQGYINKSEMGITYCHEHIFINLSDIRKEDDSILGNTGEMEEEIRHAKDFEVTGIVEVTNIGMGRDVSKLRSLSEKLNVNIICSTGFYKHEYYPDFVFQKSADELCSLMVGEIEEGIDDTGIKAGIIAEIGSSFNEITECEKKVFKASALAHLRTGVPISTHCEYGTMSVEQADFLLSMGVKPDKIIIGHSDLNENMEQLKYILSKGINVAFDTIGKNNCRSNQSRIDNLIKLINAGYEGKILLSQDITRKSYLKKNGGQGYTYIFEHFIPGLSKFGITDKTINRMLVENPARILDTQ